MQLSKILLAAVFAPALFFAASTADPSYRVVKEVAIGAPDRWDYVVYDGDQDRVFIAHSDKVTVVDNKTGTVVGHVEGMPGGTHGLPLPPVRVTPMTAGRASSPSSI